MSYNKTFVKIEEHFKELWKRQFKYNLNEWDEHIMYDWMCGTDGLWEFISGYGEEYWAEISCNILEDFNIKDTFEMLEYIARVGREFDIDLDDEDFTCKESTIDDFIYCICRETYSETDYMHYDYYEDASNKIKKWWKKIYWSPKTKVGIKRFNRECEKLGY